MHRTHSKPEEKKETLKGFIKRLHYGENPEKIKDSFKALIKDTSPLELAYLEGELMHERMPKDGIMLLFRLQLDIFHESLHPPVM